MGKLTLFKSIYVNCSIVTILIAILLLTMTNYTFNSKNNSSYKTLITQEMLEKKFLATTTFYACIEHSNEFIDKYFLELEPIFKLISDCEKGNKNIKDLLKSPVCHTGFERLN